MHTKRTKTTQPAIEERPLALDGLHHIDGLCHDCKTPTMYLDHQSGKARCVVCGYTRKNPPPFEENYCDSCETPHWPNLVSNVSGVEISEKAKELSKPTGRIKHQAKMYQARFPGALRPIYAPTQRIPQLSIEDLNDELDALLEHADEPPVDGPSGPD